MINVYDGNNILMRALNDTSLHSRNGMNLRQRYNGTLPSDIWVFDGHNHNQRRKDIYQTFQQLVERLDTVADIAQEPPFR